MTNLKWTGERVIPEYMGDTDHKQTIYKQHLARYIFAMKVVT